METSACEMHQSCFRWASPVEETEETLDADGEQFLYS